MNTKVGRDMTVGELRELLAEYPDHTPVAPFVNGTAGVMLGAELHEVDGAPVLLLGEPVDHTAYSLASQANANRKDAEVEEFARRRTEVEG